MVLFQRCTLKNLILPSPYCRGWGVLPACKSYITEFTFFLLLGHRCTGYSTISGIPGVRERTLIAVKPDGVQRRLVGQIMERFEQRGFKLVGMKMLQASEELLSQHYQELRRKPFFPSLLYYMTSGPIVVMLSVSGAQLRYSQQREPTWTHVPSPLLPSPGVDLLGYHNRYGKIRCC
ncbi:nucleoside diphosphate kinase, mitochondrial isoform X3 [Oncorhynchus masou masou]|uniref:nucleoside diphosphate kinase, mitochondrial isoform X3 n=1 Tax=Oncorhynchus masou masou TaxID=90313 RepID=UPI0031832C6C